MKILLTGASSYLGARLFFDLHPSFDIVGTYHGNKLTSAFVPLDTTNKDDIERVVNDVQPNVIIHAAANANAKWCEAHPQEAMQLNVGSTEALVAAANAQRAKIILISSFAALTPTNVYAKSKKASEELVIGTKAGYTILRPSLIIGFSPNTTNDRPFNRILKNLDEGTKAEYDTSWKFQPTFVRHISEVLRQILEKNLWEKIIPIACPELVSRYDIARDILAPFDVPVTPLDLHDTSAVTTSDLHALKDLELPEYSYEDIVGEIVQEIRTRARFVLS